MDKVVSSADEAVADIFDGAIVAIGGFFTAGTPTSLIQALARKGCKDLTLVIMTMGPGNPDVLQLVLNGQVKKTISNYPFYRSASQGADCCFEIMVRAELIEVETLPMGTFCEKLRAGGAGLAAFYTPTGVGTVVARGKEIRKFGDRDYLLETAIRPDFALVYAHKGDRMGNLICRKTARNFNPDMAAAAECTIAAVEYLVEPGQLDPDTVHVPGIFVKRVLEVGRPSYVPGL